MCSSLEAIRSTCRERGIRLTVARERVLRILAKAEHAMKAYSILEQVRQDSPNAAPPAVYRALDFLQAQGWAVKLNSINAFVLRPPGTGANAAFLVCKKCGSVEALRSPMAREELLAIAAAAGFAPSVEALEVTGLCRKCRPESKPEAGESPIRIRRVLHDFRDKSCDVITLL